MILVPHCSGQTGNKIDYFIQALALALDTGRSLWYFSGKDLCLFSDLHPEAIPEIKVHCFNRQRNKYVDGVCGLFQNNLPGMRKRYYETNVERIARFVRRPRWLPIVLWNWYFRHDAGIMRHRDKICAYLRAKDAYVLRAKALLAPLRADGSLVVGVHLRRGDYKEAYGGRYYYSDGDYLGFMRQIAAYLERPVRFVAVTNEKLDLDFFKANGMELENVSGSPEEDLVTLSECDCIVGPPSTFSWWASYYGDKPICFARERDLNLTAKGFPKVTRLESRFDNS